MKFQIKLNLISSQPNIDLYYFGVMKKSQIKKQKRQAKNSDQSQKQGQLSVKEEEDGVKNEVKIQNQEARKRWFQDDDDQDQDDDIKWEYLQHHGVTFPDPYIPKGLPVIYDGKEIKLTDAQEEMAWYWCQTIGSQYENNQIYRKNFQSQFTVSLNKEYPFIKELRLFDFSKMRNFAEKEREEKKNKTDQEKNRIKLQKEEQNKNYGYAIVDDFVEKINGFVIEPPTLFKGRGKHPKAGFLKPRIQPEQITLNLAQDAPIPKCPVAGHCWGAIESKKDSTWLCSYKNDTISSSSTYKYIFLAPNSKFKGQNDRKKYQKARRLKKCIGTIRLDYMNKVKDRDMKNKQLGTATYLIDHLALRVGNEKGEDEADTQGCCSLRVEHIDVFEETGQIKLDFLGKDSMRYENTVKVDPSVLKNIQLFRMNKTPDQDLFDKIDAQALNDYLKSQMEGLTAKVFRTYNASSTLQQELNKFNLKGLTMEEKLEKYEEANKQVAILCNHQKTVGKKVEESLNKNKQAISMQEDYLKELEKHQSKFTAKKDKIEKADEVIECEGGKPFVKKFPQTKEATTAAIKKLIEKIQREKKNLQKKDDTKKIALGTSKTNYNDPRISVAWCKKNEVKVQKVFTKNLLSKFLWAMYSQQDFEF